MLTSGFPCLKLGLHAKLHLHACLVYFLHPLLLQTIYVLLPLVDDLAEVNKLPLALLKDRVYVVFRLIAHLLNFVVQDVVVPRESAAILSLNLGYEIICPVRFVQLKNLLAWFRVLGVNSRSCSRRFQFGRVNRRSPEDSN